MRIALCIIIAVPLAASLALWLSPPWYASFALGALVTMVVYTWLGSL
jgi:hypothetical protein